jgi:hypothetical protein
MHGSRDGAYTTAADHKADQMLGEGKSAEGLLVS